jgi:hypothetical protein
MSIKRYLLKLWNSPVWSKVISGGILAILGTLVTINNWNKIKPVIFEYLSFIINYYEWFIILLLIIVIIIMTIIYAKNKSTDKKPDIRWFNKYFDNVLFENYFLLWFPINGVMSGSLAELSASDNLKIMNSRKIKLLFDKNIISMIYYGSIHIDQKIYDIIDDYISKNYNKNNLKENNVIKNLQSVKFSEIILNCAKTTKYDL